MLVNVRFMCIDIPMNTGNGNIRIDDGATVEDVLRYATLNYGIKIPVSELKNSMLLVNSKPVSYDYVLEDSDCLSVIRPMAGG